MRATFIIALLVSLSVAGQKSNKDDREKIYHHVIGLHIDKRVRVINETFIPVNKYDIDGNYQRWFYQSFPESMTVCVVPIQYEQTVLNFLESKGITLDTSSIFQQIDMMVFDNLSKYKMPASLIPFRRAPLSHSHFGNLFKINGALGLSRILLEERNMIALIKLNIFSKKKQLSVNSSSIIILQKQDTEWKTLGVISKKGN